MKKNNRLGIFMLGICFSSLLYSCSSDNNNNDIVLPPGGGNGNSTKDVSYATVTDWQGNTVSLTMDIYKPAGLSATDRRPLVMHMHGGGFNDGDKTSSTDKCLLLADSGFIAVTINYRVGWAAGGDTDPCVGDTASFNDELIRAVQDGHAALRFLVANAEKYNIDPNNIFLSGASAGATMALGIAYYTDDYVQGRYPKSAAKLGSLYTSGNNLQATYTFKGICAIAGALPDSNLITQQKSYPAITFQGEDDVVIPINAGKYNNCENFPMEYGSLCQYRQLRRFGKPAIANILHDAGHGNNGEGGYDSPFMMGNAACFFHTILRKEVAKSGIYFDVTYTCTE